jgi:hypothetical protein
MRLRPTPHSLLFGYALILLSIEQADDDDDGDGRNWNRGVPPRYGP